MSALLFTRSRNSLAGDTCCHWPCVPSCFSFSASLSFCSLSLFSSEKYSHIPCINLSFPNILHSLPRCAFFSTTAFHCQDFNGARALCRQFFVVTLLTNATGTVGRAHQRSNCGTGQSFEVRREPVSRLTVGSRPVPRGLRHGARDVEQAFVARCLAQFGSVRQREVAHSFHALERSQGIMDRTVSSSFSFSRKSRRSSVSWPNSGPVSQPKL